MASLSSANLSFFISREEKSLAVRVANITKEAPSCQRNQTTFLEANEVMVPEGNNDGTGDESRRWSKIKVGESADAIGPKTQM